MITNQGLVGTVTKVLANESQVMLITDPESAVRAVDAKNLAGGRDPRPRQRGDLARPRPASGRTRASPSATSIITAGSPVRQQARRRSSRAGSRSGPSRASSQTDTDIYKQIQVQPFVDLSSLESVLVLIPKAPGAGSELRARRRSRRSRFLFVAVLSQVSVLGAYTPLGGTRRPRARRADLDRAPSRLDLRRVRRVRRRAC